MMEAMLALHMAIRDTDVEVRGDSLAGRTVLLGVSGGIAAVDTVRLGRELRRHGADVRVALTHSAQRIITPLAVEWATQGDVITDWDGNMDVLNEVDGVLVAPATRDTMASFVHGLQHGPLMMALSVARSRDCPVMMVPSMHMDLAKDPVTDDIVQEVRKHGISVLWGEEEEGKRKTPHHEEIVARFAHHMNVQKPNRKDVVITLGSTRSAIDDIRYVQNTSSGATGFALADDLYRHGHDVTCVAGVTSSAAPKWLPLLLKTPEPNQMLKELQVLAKDKIHAWIHTAAVLDYLVANPAEGKLASQQGSLNIELIEGEIKNSKVGKEAKICIKINSLQDKEVINKLYDASNSGVKVCLIVRGICCLRPAIKDLSQNIEVISIGDCAADEMFNTRPVFGIIGKRLFVRI